MRRESLAFLVAAVAPALADAGTLYKVTSRFLAEAPSPPVSVQYFVEEGSVRAGSPDAKVVLVFRDRTIYVIDNVARTILITSNATLDQASAKIAETAKNLGALATAAPADERAMKEQAASVVEGMNARWRGPVRREYLATERSEVVDDKRCRIWEMIEAGVKRLELCVAPAESIPGADEILAGMKALSQYPNGAAMALGVDLGPSDWWPGVERLQGVPILIREFKEGRARSETRLTSMRPGVPARTYFELPEGYTRQERSQGKP